MKRLLPTVTATLLLALLSAGATRADRRYFVQSYTPYLAPAGEVELEVFSNAFVGQGDSTNTAWQNRVELEYAISNRLTGGFHMNFIQPAGASMTFDGPSLELIYRLSEPGKLPVDPAAYLEVRANGDEVEVEPKLLLARRIYKLVTVMNVVGEFEHIHAGPDAGETEKALELTGGLSRELGHTVAVGLEAVYARSFAEQGPDASSLRLGPTINLQTSKVQLAIGWHPQLTGSPSTSGGLNLADFPRSEVRLILGVDL